MIALNSDGEDTSQGSDALPSVPGKPSARIASQYSPAILICFGVLRLDAAFNFECRSAFVRLHAGEIQSGVKPPHSIFKFRVHITLTAAKSTSVSSSFIRREFVTS